MAERAFISPSYEIPDFTKKQNAALRRIIYEIESHGPHEGVLLRGVNIVKNTAEAFASGTEKRVTFDVDSFGATSHDTGELRWSTADAGTVFCDRVDVQRYYMFAGVEFKFGTGSDTVFGTFFVRLIKRNADDTETFHTNVRLRLPRAAHQRINLFGSFDMKKDEGIRVNGFQDTGSSADVEGDLHVFGPVAGLTLPPGI